MPENGSATPLPTKAAPNTLQCVSQPSPWRQYTGTKVKARQDPLWDGAALQRCDETQKINQRLRPAKTQFLLLIGVCRKAGIPPLRLVGVTATVEMTRD